MSRNGHKVRIGKLSEFRPQASNANKHTERGLGLLDNAMSEDGYVAPMTAVADGEIIDGSARLERAYERFSDEAIIVEHDGSRPIIAKRVDIPNADNPLARRISLRANRIAELNLDWNPEILQSVGPEILKGMFSDKELAEILSQFDVDTVDAPELSDGDRAPFRQCTFTLHDEQFEEVDAAIRKAKEQGGGQSSVNENSNGNALAWICGAFNRG